VTRWAYLQSSTKKEKGRKRSPTRSGRLWNDRTSKMGPEQAADIGTGRLSQLIKDSWNEGDDGGGGARICACPQERGPQTGP